MDELSPKMLGVNVYSLDFEDRLSILLITHGFDLRLCLERRRFRVLIKQTDVPGHSLAREVEPFPYMSGPRFVMRRYET